MDDRELPADGADKTVTEAVVLNAYLTEYSECMSSYRHTYQTIWQVGSFFAAISAGMFAFSNADGGDNWAMALAPLPLILWWLGVFEPMNRYGESRKRRLEAIERLLSEQWGIDFKHYRNLAQEVERRNLAEEGAQSASGFEFGSWRVSTAVRWFAGILVVTLVVLVVHEVQDRPTPAAEDRPATGPWLVPPSRTQLSHRLTAVRVFGKEPRSSARVGRWSTPALSSLNEDSVRAVLALPSQNDMSCVAVVTIPAGTPVEMGWAAPYEGQPGGGYQISVGPDPNPAWYAPGSSSPWESDPATARECASR